ncbi:MAG: hypothetical protein FWH04_05805 [Oscillospiraceae bacterium]|nr:hypothetical protein [Oscillospiraceae bacterium]
MSKSKLMKISYYDPKAEVHLTNYADTIVVDTTGCLLAAIRFGGYPESVRAMSDAIYGGCAIDVEVGGKTKRYNSLAKQYQRNVTPNGVYAEATLIIDDDKQKRNAESGDDGDEEKQTDKQAKNSFIFSEKDNPTALFEQLDQKTAVPLIPQFQDYFLAELKRRELLKQLAVISFREKFDAWMLHSTNDDTKIISIIDDGLKNGKISIPGAVQTNAFDEVSTVSGYLKAFGATVGNRIRDLFRPLFNPAEEPLSPEILAVNEFVKSKTPYSLFDAQMATAEALKRQLDRSNAALLVAECGSGKSKIGSAALWAHHQGKNPGGKTFNIVLSPSHITDKWVREIEETLPNTFGGVITSPEELDKFYAAYDRGNKTAFAVISKEKARDGYMKQPSVIWSRRKGAFVCPDCGKIITMELSNDGCKYRVDADQFYFRREHRSNHKCENPKCKTPLWSALNPLRQSAWVKIGGYGFVYRYRAFQHLEVCHNPKTCEQIRKIADLPDDYYPPSGAYRRAALSSYIKRTLKGRVDGLLLDELHQYSNESGQGDAMAELCGTAKKVIGMTATLINGYSKGMFYILFRLAAPLMLRDGRKFHKPNEFNREYGVVENIYELENVEYNANRRAKKSHKRERQLPGVSPLVYSRFLLETAVFLSLVDMGKDLPEYEEIPIPLNMHPDVKTEYDRVEKALKEILKSDKKIAQKILSGYLGLLTVYPDQPYGQEPIINPLDRETVLVQAKDKSKPGELHEKDLKVMEIVREKVAKGERVLIYASWTRIDTQEKMMKLLSEEGIRADLLTTKTEPRKREKWVAERIAKGLQVLIVNPSLVETGLDLNDFTTLIFYNINYNLFTLRQSSRRSWRINQTAPRIEVYFFYYIGTMQHRALRLMASKLAAATIIEGCISDEGLAAMSECADMTTLLAKELTLGIKCEIDDIADTFKKMAMLKPEESDAPQEMLAPKTAVQTEVQKLPEPVVIITPPSKKNISAVAVMEQLSMFDMTA